MIGTLPNAQTALHEQKP